jgi:multidrug efflux pump subunit AcrA (membrane-fusion protein)
MIKRHGWLTASWIACALAAGVPSQAQVERSGGGELQKFMQQYQQLAAEKTALQAQTVQMQKDLDAAKAELAAAKKERDALKVRAAAAGTEAASIAQLNSSREATDNLQLFEIGNEVLNRYEHVGLFTKVSALEPFTRLTRTRIDNLVDEYRARALENRVQKRPTH